MANENGSTLEGVVADDLDKIKSIMLTLASKYECKAHALDRIAVLQENTARYISELSQVMRQLAETAERSQKSV